MGMAGGASRQRRPFLYPHISAHIERPETARDCRLCAIGVAMLPLWANNSLL